MEQPALFPFLVGFLPLCLPVLANLLFLVSVFLVILVVGLMVLFLVVVMYVFVPFVGLLPILARPPRRSVVGLPRFTPIAVPRLIRIFNCPEQEKWSALYAYF